MVSGILSRHVSHQNSNNKNVMSVRAGSLPPQNKKLVIYGSIFPATQCDSGCSFKELGSEIGSESMASGARDVPKLTAKLSGAEQELGGAEQELGGAEQELGGAEQELGSGARAGRRSKSWAAEQELGTGARAGQRSRSWAAEQELGSAAKQESRTYPRARLLNQLLFRFV